MENKRPIPEDDREKHEEIQIAELTQRIIREIRTLEAEYPDNTYPLMYALAFIMVENGATSRMNLDGMTRSVKQFMDRIQREQDSNRNRANPDSSRESNPDLVQNHRVRRSGVPNVCQRNTLHHV